MRLRYSFKVLLIVFSALAVCIGTFAVRLHGARRQRDAVAALRAAGASVSYKYETWDGGPVMNVPDPLGPDRGFGLSEVSSWKVWLAQRLGRDFVFDVGHVYNGTPLSADLVARLAELRGLNHLHLNVGKAFDDAAWSELLRCRQIEQLTLQREHFDPTRRLAGLANLDQLEVLEIEHGELTAEDVQEIARLPKLRELTLSLVGVADDKLKPLARLKNLEGFHLVHRGHGREVTSEGVAFLAQLPELRSLTLARLPSLNDDVFANLELIPQLESLNLDQATITGVELRRCACLPNLKSLNLIGTQVDDEAMEKVAALGQLESLDISCTKVTDAGLKHLASLKRLRNLNVYGDAIADDGAAEIARMSRLEELMVGNTGLGDAGLKQLAKLPKLRALWLGGQSKVTKAGVTAFKAALPECSVYED